MSSLHGLDSIVRFLPILLPLVLIELGLRITALVHLLKRNKAKYMPVWGWVLIILLVSTLGWAAYFIFGREDA